MVTLRFSWSEKSVDSKVSFPHLNFGKVQEVVEDAQQRHRRRFQESEIFLLFRGKGGIEDKIGHADDAVHRCTDFMADIG
jgi:hypothetical protein